MMLYILKSCLLLAILYGAFALLLSRETFHRFNRLALLGVMIASLVLPAIHITMQKPGFLIMEQGAWSKEQENTTEMLTLEQSYIQIAQSNIPEPREIVASNEEIIPVNPLAPCSLPLAPILYICGLLASLSIFFLQLFRLWRETKGGVRTKDELGNTIIIHGGDFAPYSFLHYIFISASDYEHLRRPILTHEQAHIRLGHTYDLLLFEVVKAVQWFNPFVYLLGRDLKAVHEYEADNAVLNFGIDAKTYQLLLVTKAVGGRLQTVCNNLSHHSLKKRIKMMHTHNSNRWLMGKGLILPALMALAVVAFAKTAPSDSPEGESTALPAVEDNNQVQDDKPVTVAVPGMGLVMTDEVQGISKKKMLKAFIPKDNAQDFIKKHGPAITVSWLKGTWVVRDEDSYVEEHPDCQYPLAFHTKYYRVMLDGKELDVNNLPDLPASALKKVEIQTKSNTGKLTVKLTTTPVQIPANVKGNINPELTILLTGTPPKDSGAKTTIWERRGIFEGFSWKNYTICSWKWDVDDISVHLKEVAIRKDHNVRINVCKGVPQKHIDRIKSIMQECGVTNYKFVNQ
ncbi:MAG: M56 family metallopeptidase [Bacteroidaceae bacterium]|nr:M56 family metallopeptidase [Bacteroidaceae bacterium]